MTKEHAKARADWIALCAVMENIGLDLIENSRKVHATPETLLASIARLFIEADEDVQPDHRQEKAFSLYRRLQDTLFEQPANPPRKRE